MCVDMAVDAVDNAVVEVDGDIVVVAVDCGMEAAVADIEDAATFAAVTVAADVDEIEMVVVDY